MSASDINFRQQLAGTLLMPVNAGDPITIRGAQEILAQDFPRKATVDALLQRLAQFGLRHFEFFDSNLLEDGNGRVKPSRVFPREAVLALIVNQVQQDAEVILRAAHQRLVPSYQATLQLADDLVYRALKAAEGELRLTGANNWYGEPATALTYFHKSPEIRVIPYAPVALIGIPMACLNAKRDFLAIAHEVGHYIYHNRYIDSSNDPVNRTYASQTNPFAHWQEETFADVCAALIAGGVMVFDFQEISKEYHREFFISRQDHHPSPFLRPLLYSYAYRAWRDPDVQTTANLLDERWGRIVAERWSRELKLSATPTIRELIGRLRDLQDDFGLTEDHDKKHLENLRKELSGITLRGERMILGPELAALADQALARLSMQDDWSGTLSKMETGLQQNKDDLDQGFIEKLDAGALTKLSAPDLGPVPLYADPWLDWIRHEHFFGDITPEDFPDSLTAGTDSFDFFWEPANPLRPMGQPPVYTWQQLWFASGWTTEAPTSNPPGG